MGLLGESYIQMTLVDEPIVWQPLFLIAMPKYLYLSYNGKANLKNVMILYVASSLKGNVFSFNILPILAVQSLYSYR